MKEFWDLEDTERLMYDDFDEAMEHILDDFEEGEEPETIEICRYERDVVKPSFLEGRLLESALEDLECDFGDPDCDDWPEPTSRMIEAEKEFIKVILEEYEVPTFKVVEKKIVNVKEYLNSKK